MKSFSRIAALAGAVAVASLVGGAALLPANAKPASGSSQIQFFAGGTGSAGWVHGADAPGDTDGYAIQLSAPDSSSYGGVDLGAVPTSPPANPPSFWYQSLQSGASGGSPRLVMCFGDSNCSAGTIVERPLTLVAGQWAFVSGQGNDFDVSGAPLCSFAYAVTYSAAVACEAGQPVTDAFVVVDQFAYPSGLTINVDDISYGSEFVTAPHPSSANDCKKGGWQSETDANGNTFKNQGDCVSYVSNGK